MVRANAEDGTGLSAAVSRKASTTSASIPFATLSTTNPATTMPTINTERAGPLDRTAEHNDRIADITEMILDTGIDMPVDDVWDLATAIDAKFIVPAWIPCSESLPKANGGDGPFATFSSKVLVIARGGHFRIGFYSHEDGKWRVNGRWQSVVYWMPSPLAPAITAEILDAKRQD